MYWAEVRLAYSCSITIAAKTILWLTSTSTPVLATGSMGWTKIRWMSSPYSMQKCLWHICYYYQAAINSLVIHAATCFPRSCVCVLSCQLRGAVWGNWATLGSTSLPLVMLLIFPRGDGTETYEPSERNQNMLREFNRSLRCDVPCSSLEQQLTPSWLRILIAGRLVWTFVVFQ